MRSAKLSHFCRHNPGLVTALLAAIAIVPLIIPVFPPLTDLPGHLGRYAVQTGLAHDPLLARWYSFDWTLIGNLGVDILVQVLAPILGVERSVTLIVIGIVALTVTGFMMVSRAAQGGIGPAALFAFPLAYGFPFQFGFINYCLSMALALLGYALWMRLGAAGKIGLRAVLFVPLSSIVWLAHIGGWGALGLFALASEVMRLRGSGHHLLQSWFRAAINCVPLALPVLITIIARQHNAAGETGDWFNWLVKYQWFMMALNDKWQWFDLVSVMTLMMLIVFARIKDGLGFNPTLGLATLLLFGAFLCMPRVLIGSAYADMRLAPFVLAMAVLAIEARPEASLQLRRGLMFAGLAFFLIRTGATTFTFLGYDRMMRSELAALDHIPRHARIVAFIGRKCYAEWQLERRTHISSLAIVRRHAFTNDQFEMPGAQLISVHYGQGKPFNTDPSQMVTDDSCVRTDWMTFTKSVALIPRAAFDYLWVIEPPAENKADMRGFTPVWRNGRSTLYRVEH